MVETLLIITVIVCALVVGVIVWMMMKQFDRQRAEWNSERAKLLDRIQAKDLTEFKAHERADNKVVRQLTPEEKEKKRIEAMPWG